MTNNQTNQNQLINDLVRNGKQGRTWGAKSRLMNCDSCETNYTLSESKYKKEYGEKNK